MRTIIREIALENAVRFNGKANPKAIVDAVLEEFPQAKEDMTQTMKTIHEEVEVVNDLELEEQKNALQQLRPKKSLSTKN